MTQPTLSRQVSALEADLSLLLFERVGRGLVLTDAGRELLAHVRDMGAAADRLTVSAIGHQSGISGRVSISASDILSHTILPGVVADLRRRAPQLAIEVVATNQLSDLLRREADIAIRHVRPEQPNLVARRVREGHGPFYAAPTYLDRRGRPATPEALAKLDWVAFGNPGLMCSHIRSMGVPVTTDSFVVHSENGIVAWEMVCSGMGICPMDASIAGQEPQVEPVLADRREVDFPVWLVTHREIHNSPRIRLVFDHLAEVLARV